MHFGLYAFDLYERIYKEAWQLEAELGAEAFVREGDLKPLHQTYESFESYKIEVPRLIIEHNIHGVDIDPRAVQIAGLSLWQRAQRAWQQQDIKPQHRPVVRKSNIVCAEPMPGEKVLLQEFASSLNPPVLGQLLEAVFDKMELAGEAGTLLKIEEEIQSSIHEAKDQWQAQSGSNSVGDMFQAELDQATPQRKLGFDLSGVDDESFWDGAEQLILDALSNYADKAASNADQKRLFAEDAAKGFAFIDLCRKRFDVVLMNPPFGQATDKTFEYLRLAENINFVELYASFVSRALDLIAEGYVGAITSKGFFSMTRLAEWRQGCFTPNVHLIADLGLNVMDSAFVESAAYVLGNSYKQNEIFVKDVADEQVKDRYIRSDAWSYDAHHANGSLFVVHRDIFLQMPEGKVVYRAAEKLGSLFNIEDKFESYGGVVRTGLTTFDDNRFVRLLWEVPIGSIGEGLAWEPFSKGGEFAKYYAEVYLCVKRKQNGAELAAVNIIRNGQVAQSRQGATYYYRPGLTFTSRSSRGFSVRALPAGCVISHNAPTIYPVRQTTNEYLLGWANSRLVRMLAEVQASASYYTPGSIKDLPWIDPERSTVDAVAISSNKLFQYYREQYEQDECSIAFIGIDSKSIFDKAISDKKSIGNERQEKIIIEQMRISGLIDKLYGMDSSELSIEILGVDSDRDVPLISDTEKDWYSRFISYHFGIAIGRWACLKNQHPSHDEKKANGFGLFKPYSSLLVTNIIKSRDGNDGILVDDETHEKHLIKAIKKSVSASAMDPRYEWLEVLEKGLSVKSLGSYFVDMKAFFSWHLAQYSKSRRSAPIYWPIQTPSGSYTLWFYYHALNKQTLYSGVNDYIEPRLRTIEEDLYRLRSQASRSSQDEKKLAHLTDLAKELREFRDELLRIAKFWRPNLNDGVQITAAPLWKLFQHKAWQKKLKETWENLEKGDYDWAHLACSIWPERVLRKCHQDRSLAIAHDVEDTFWHEIEVPVMRGKKATGETKLEWQPKELTDDELDALIQAKIKEMRA